MSECKGHVSYKLSRCWLSTMLRCTIVKKSFLSIFLQATFLLSCLIWQGCEVVFVTRHFPRELSFCKEIIFEKKNVWDRERDISKDCSHPFNFNDNWQFIVLGSVWGLFCCISCQASFGLTKIHFCFLSLFLFSLSLQFAFAFACMPQKTKRGGGKCRGGGMVLSADGWARAAPINKVEEELSKIGRRN